jgi:hypothetical protein
MIVMSNPAAVSAQQSPLPAVVAPVTGGPLTIAMQVTINPNYDFLGSGTNTVSASIVAPQLNVPQGVSVEILTSFLADHITEVVTLNGVNQSLAYSVASGRYGIFYGYNSVVPANSTSFSASISGTQGGSAFLWRYVSSFPLVQLSGLNLPVLQTATMVAPSGTVLSQLYDHTGASLPLSSSPPINRTGSETTYAVDLNTKVLVMQPSIFVPASIAITVMAIAMTVLAGLNLFPRGRLILARGTRPIRNIVPLGAVGHAFRRPTNLKGFLKSLFQPKKLLTLFLLCALLMVAVGAVAGPDPRLKAYVMADPNSVNQIQSSLDQAHGNVFAITPAQDYSDVVQMASVGEFNVLVVSNYPPLDLPEVSKFVLPALSDIPLVIVDDSADPGFVTQIRAFVSPDAIVHVHSVGSLDANETQTLSTYMSTITRPNVLGLDLSSSGFKVVEIVEALLSFVLIFSGLAFLGSLASESTSQTDFAHLATVISSGVFVFFFSEVIYVVTSALLTVPVSLHAVVSGAHDITAVGLLGFGGGSTPRLAAGVLGFIMGLVVSGGVSRVRLGDFALIAGIVLIIIASPFFLGQYVFQAMLLFGSSNFGFGNAYTSSLSFKSFLYGVGGALGGNTSSTYLMSAGKILFFAGLVPFAYFKKMGKTSTALAVLIVALMIGDGGVRVGEMTPDKTVIAIIPGIVVGFVFLIPLIGVALVEKYVRGKWNS